MKSKSAPDLKIERAQPESLRGRGLQASLTVKDIKKSVAWYRDIVGFTVGKEFERDGRLVAVRLVAGAVELLLTPDDGAKGLDRAKGEGMSLSITTTQDIDELASRIKNSGGKLTAEPMDAHGARVFRITDPDGFKFVISSERA
jgi:predicted enzyme related to lactoylglutathione lyase